MQLKLLMLQDSHNDAEYIEGVLRKEKIDFVSKRVNFEDKSVNLKVVNSNVINAQSIFSEVTERKKDTLNPLSGAQGALVQYEAYYKALVEHGSYIKTLLSESGNISYVSPSITNILGFSQEECLKKTLFDFLHRDDVKRMRIMLERLVSTPRKSFYLQQRILNSKGTYSWFEGTITNLLSETGVNSLVLNLRETAERNKAEDILRDTEKFHRVVTDIPTIGIAWISIDRKILNANNSLCNMLGYSLEAMKGMSFNDITHPDDLVKDKELNVKVLTGEIDNFSVEKRYITNSGAILWVNVHVSSSRDQFGKVQYLIGIVADITDKKKAEEALLKSEANLRTIVNNTDVSYILTDRDLNIVSFNRCAHREIYEETDENLKEGAFLGNFRLADKWSSVEAYKRVITGEHIRSEGSYIKRDGTVCWFSRRLSPVKDNNNDIVGMIMSTTDITSRKLAELEREKMTTDIVERNKDLEQFAFIVSHNLRSPVANILALSDAITNYELTDHERNDMLAGLSNSVNKLDDVVLDLNQILHIKRQLKEQKEKVRLSNLISEVKVQIRQLTKQENVKIVTNFNDTNEIFTIKSYLYNVFYNFISNSIKFRKPNVVPVIEITYRKTSDKEILIFKDNGLGINLSKNKDQIFGLYKRFHTHVEGKGVGLYMAKTQVETLGGKISVKSKVNEGTQFTVELPVKH